MSLDLSRHSSIRRCRAGGHRDGGRETVTISGGRGPRPVRESQAREAITKQGGRNRYLQSEDVNASISSPPLIAVGNRARTVDVEVTGWCPEIVHAIACMWLNFVVGNFVAVTLALA
ncbi:hypothetical protein TIFTF001_017092 [Ficus carica]|uniref:Uncharacterized protein n=1 Tax=Ficus carica TaxID=3494 RepID=A0AA88AQ07_FICCA|nr:hypothetical protein TIFTF001_017092 [Ficus carica]